MENDFFKYAVFRFSIEKVLKMFLKMCGNPVTETWLLLFLKNLDNLCTVEFV